MRRKALSSCPALESALKSLPEKAWKTYQCTLVTPMYGGGVEAGKVDCNMPIRASSIRGQLRFWWRIACGPFKSTQDMFEQECAIWGGIGDDGAKASCINIQTFCKSINNTQLVSSKLFKDRGSKYILGAAESTDCLKSGYMFNLKIANQFEVSKEIENQIETAIRWWMSFGGLGGRTRRGFGTVDVKDLIPISKHEVELLGGKLVFASEACDSAETAWQKASLTLYQFRQGENVGRNKGEGNRPGRSRWPEPDQLRRMTGKHKTTHAPEHLAGNVFPRAAFGLPIIYDFNDRTHQEPQTMTLLPKGAQRMASPLVIHPYKSGDKWTPAALLLPQWDNALSEPLMLDRSPEKNETPNSWPDAEHQEERDRLANVIRPMKQEHQLRANDPLSAFLDYFEKGQ